VDFLPDSGEGCREKEGGVKMVTRLKNLKILEVSSVDAAACEGARIVLMKRDDAAPRESATEGNIAMDMVDFAKIVASGGGSMGLNRDDFYQEIVKRSGVAKQASETKEQAFARYVQEDDAGRLLYGAYKKAPSKPIKNPDRFRDDESNMTPAYRRLRDKAKELLKAQPALTKERAFARVYGDPANRDLVADYKAELKMARSA
jgi:hypothetical protein